MKRTYILVLEWSLMPWKDLRLAVFMFVRIMYLKEKGRSVDYENLRHSFLVSISQYVYNKIDHRISTVLIG